MTRIVWLVLTLLFSIATAIWIFPDNELFDVLAGEFMGLIIGMGFWALE